MSAAPLTVARLTPLPRLLLVCLLALLGLAAGGAAWADPPGRVGRIAQADGTVWLFDDDQGEWIQARRNRPVTEGDRVSTERGSRAEIQVGAATLRIDGGTEIEFVQLDDSRVRMTLRGGSVALRMRGGDSAREFAIATREGRFEPLRAGRYRVDARDDGSFGQATKGSLRFEAADSVLDIQDGQRAEFWSERGVTHYAWAQPADDRFAEWVAREEREEDRARERNRYVSREMTGGDDLDRYGQWDQHPEYGPVWYPATVAVGWAPYRYGHWAFIRPWGWTWVDDAPWGFAPFHYGRWVNYGGRWGWCPGTYVARPVYAPALVGWFSGSNVSVGISIGGGPAVGWVPLAPREVYVPTYQVTNIYIRNVNVTHERWQPRERAIPTGPIMYTNQGVAGGVTVVPQGVMQGRQPISSAVAVKVDPRAVANWRGEAPKPGTLPVAPPTRVVAVPGGAVPVVPPAPNALRNNPWTRTPESARAGAARGDGGESRGTPPGRERPGMRVETPQAPQAPQAPNAPQRPQAPKAPQGTQPAPGAQPQPPQVVPPPQVVQPPQQVQTPQQVQRERREKREQERANERRVAPAPQGSTPVPQGAPAPVPPAAQPVRPVAPAQQVLPPPQLREPRDGRPVQVPGQPPRAQREERNDEPRNERGQRRGEGRDPNR